MVNRPASNSSSSTTSTTKGGRSPVTRAKNTLNSFQRSNSDNDYKTKNSKVTKSSSIQNMSNSVSGQSFRNSLKPSNGNKRNTKSSSMEVLNQAYNMDAQSDTSSTTPEDSINVVVRVRPLNDKEKKNRDEMIAQFPGNGQILCEGLAGTGQSSGVKPKLFSYNVVFEPGATQDDVVQYSGIKRLIEMAVEGFSCTAFCYGQTGSGKTHTLTGPPELFFDKPNPTHKGHGLIFRAFVYLFQLLQARQDTQFVLKASFLEIYNEKVIDLLNPAGSSRKPLAVRWAKKSRGFFVENLFTVDCEELDDLMAVLEEGMRNRSTGAHSMNDYSSRSHTILTVHITSETQAENAVFISKQGKINFVDLAGSEMTKKTHSEGKTLEEANNINKSLMVLGYCIASLSDPKKRNGHIPYRDSKLTKLLADSLAGNGVTLMIACISPARSNITETVNTLRYAARAKKIRTKPIIVMDPREALILSMKREINALQMENEHLKSVLHLQPMPQFNNEMMISTVLGIGERNNIPEAPKVDVEKLTELEGNELSELVKLYMVENQALRTENSELYSTREMIVRDQEVVCRENERLLKKLEDVNSVCCRSPIIPARTTLTGDVFNFSTGSDNEMGNSNYWRNPMSASTDSVASLSKYNKMDGPMDGRISTSNQIPDSIQKELDKRRIGESINSIANNLRRTNSWSRSSSGSSLRAGREKGSAESVYGKTHVSTNKDGKDNIFVDMIS